MKYIFISFKSLDNGHWFKLVITKTKFKKEFSDWVIGDIINNQQGRFEIKNIFESSYWA